MLVAAVVAATTSATPAKKPPPKPNKKAAAYEYLVGASSPKPGGFALCSVPVPNPCPDVAKAATGDTIRIFGTGTLSVHAKSVSGGGSYASTNATVGSGTWTGTKLLSFKAYGTNPNVTAGATAGKALIRVKLSNGARGVLRITCVLPGVKVPKAFHEGVRLAVTGGPNFNKEAGGLTLFIRQ
jgi:hypothetical protein